MAVLTNIPNNTSARDWRDTMNALIKRIAALEAAGVPVETPAPAFTTQPSVSPTSGTAGSTIYAATPGTVSNGSVVSRVWLLNGTAISSGVTALPASSGTLAYQETASGPSGTTTSTVQVAAVTAATVTPAPAPSFTSQPSISPASGTAGVTTFTAAAGNVSNGTITSRSWTINGTVISTGLTASPASSGTLTYQETATGPGGTEQSTVQQVTVATAAAAAPAFTTQPTVSPSTGTAGTTTYTATSGAVSNGTITSRAWALNGSVISTGLTAAPTSAGTLTYQEFATGTGGSASSSVLTRTVSAATPTLTLSPASISIASNAAAGTTVSNITNVPAGVTPTVTPNDGRLVIAGDASAGWKVVVGMSALSAGTINFSVAAAGATGASGVITVAAAASNLRQVANGCRIMTNAVAGAANFNSRTAHIATDSVVPALVIANWRWNSSGGADTNSGYEQTYEAALEYPAGTITRVTFGGSNSGVMSAAMDQLQSDAASVIVPAGATYWWRVNMVTSTGYYSFSKDPVGDVIPAAVGSLETGTTLANKVMSGIIGQTSTATAWFPLAIVGNTTKTTIMVVGDSIGRGANGAWTSSFNHGYIEEAVGTKFGVLNISAYGDTASSFINGTNSAKRRTLKQYCSHVIVEYGCNDVNGSTSATNIINNLNTLAAFFSDKSYYRTTLTPRSSGAWTLADGSDQTVGTNFAPGGKHDTVQAAIKAGLPNALGVFDPVPAAFNTTTNKWLADGTTNKNTIDGVHPSPVAVFAMASAISSAVQAIDGSSPVTDITPDAFAFIDVTNAAPSTLTESNAITVSGINAASAIGVSGGEYQINGGSWVTAAGTVTNGQTVKVRLTSSSAASTTSNVTLTIGGVSDTFSVTTAAAAGQTGLLTRTATLAAWDASDRTTMFQSADSSVPVTATAQPVARLNDKRGVNNYHLIAPTDAQRPLSTGGLTFDGTDDSLNFAFATTGPTLGTMVYIVKTMDTVGSIGNNTSSTTAFHGAFKSGDTGSSSFGTNASSQKYFKNGTQITSNNRNLLFTNMCDGVANILEVTTITMTQYVGLAIAYSRYDATFMASGVIIPVALLDQNASDYTDALTEARTFAQAIIGRLGL